jgi:hypothetical protein
MIQAVFEQEQAPQTPKTKSEELVAPNAPKKQTQPNRAFALLAQRLSFGDDDDDDDVVMQEEPSAPSVEEEPKAQSVEEEPKAQSVEEEPTLEEGEVVIGKSKRAAKKARAKANKANKAAEKAEVAKAEVAKAEVAKAEVAKAEVAKAEVAKAEVAKVEVAKQEVAKAEVDWDLNLIRSRAFFMGALQCYVYDATSYGRNIEATRKDVLSLVELALSTAIPASVVPVVPVVPVVSVETNQTVKVGKTRKGVMSLAAVKPQQVQQVQQVQKEEQEPVGMELEEDDLPELVERTKPKISIWGKKAVAPVAAAPVTTSGKSSIKDIMCEEEKNCKSSLDKQAFTPKGLNPWVRHASNPEESESRKRGASVMDNFEENRGSSKHAKMPCKFGESCTNNATDHTSKYSHPCSKGIMCKNMNDLEHAVNFTHPCSQTHAECQEDGADDDHFLMRTHVCTFGEDCHNTTAAHQGKFTHPQKEKCCVNLPCIYRNNCTNGTKEHLEAFLHPCVLGKKCQRTPKHMASCTHKCNDFYDCEDFSDEHRRLFLHGCVDGRACENTSNTHKAMYDHKR